MEHFGSDFLVVSDADGTEYELEVLAELEYLGVSYIYAAFSPTSADSLDAVFLKNMEEDGESVLERVEDQQELAALEALLEDQIFDSDL